jgi:integrase
LRTPSFRSAFKRRRCLVVADGYYEWRAIGKKKQPYYHRLTTDRPLKSERIFEGLTGTDRRMLYALAMMTGFRARELANLSPISFDLDAERPTVTVKAAYSKNRREAVQPLPLDVAGALWGYLANRPASLPVWPGEWYTDAAEMLRFDLEAATIPYRDAEGHVCDVHALRHSYVSRLARSGIHPKLAQELARHSDIRLTMNVYTHARLHDLAGAVDGLPALLGPKIPEAQTLQATGTDICLTPVCALPDFQGACPIPIETGREASMGNDAGHNHLNLQAIEAREDSSRPIDT